MRPLNVQEIQTTHALPHWLWLLWFGALLAKRL